MRRKQRTPMFDRLESKLLLDGGVSLGPLPNVNLGPFPPVITSPIGSVLGTLGGKPVGSPPGDYLPGNGGLV